MNQQVIPSGSPERTDRNHVVVSSLTPDDYNLDGTFTTEVGIVAIRGESRYYNKANIYTAESDPPLWWVFSFWLYGSIQLLAIHER